MGPYKANQERPPRQYDTVFRDDREAPEERYQVYYNGDWWWIGDYMIIDPKTRTETDQETIFKALQNAAKEIADDRGREEIGPVFSGGNDVLSELLRRAKRTP